MSEIEELYENAGVRYFDINACKIDETGKNGKHNIYRYPPFTAEKQLKIIVFLVKKGYSVTFANLSKQFSLEQISKSIALCINSKWQDLTEEEKAEIKEILNEG